MMSFNDFSCEYGLQKKQLQNIKIHQVLSSIGLDNVDLYL